MKIKDLITFIKQELKKFYLTNHPEWILIMSLMYSLMAFMFLCLSTVVGMMLYKYEGFRDFMGNSMLILITIVVLSKGYMHLVMKYKDKHK